MIIKDITEHFIKRFEGIMIEKTVTFTIMPIS